MMYTPNHYKENRTELIYQIIRDHSFATLVSQDAKGPVVSHLPLLLEVAEGQASLLGHCAKANLHWKKFSDRQKITVIFNGPHSYISPAWYRPKLDNVPTWNYVAVHVEGYVDLLSDPKNAFDLLRKTTDHYESEYQTGWALPERPNEAIEKLLQHIVAFRISVTDIQAKFKLSQKQDTLDRDNVIHKLSLMGDDQKKVSKLMDTVLVPGSRKDERND